MNAIPSIRHKSGWYAVHTKPRRELQAKAALEEASFEVFYPREWRQIRHARTEKRELRPVMPGYIFVSIPREEDFPVINGSNGVATILYGPEGPHEIPTHEMRRMWDMTTAGGVLRIDAKQRQKRAKHDSGARVRITKGPFTGLFGRVEVDSESSVVICMEASGLSVACSPSILALADAV